MPAFLDNIYFYNGVSLVATLLELLDQARSAAVTLQSERDALVLNAAATQAKIDNAKAKLAEATALLS